MKENDNRFDWPNSNGGECPLCGFSCSASSTPDDVFGADIECNDCSFSCSDADLTKAKYKTDLATAQAEVERLTAELDARGSQWVAVNSADDLPKEFDWYEVTVKETSSLGTFRYVDILSFGHSADCGNCWMNLPENGRVIAWRERSKPYTADSGQEGKA